MRKSERQMLIAAINDLEQETCQWEDAMTKLYSLAGLEYKDWRKVKGRGMNVIELLAEQEGKIS